MSLASKSVPSQDARFLISHRAAGGICARVVSYIYLCENHDIGLDRGRISVILVSVCSGKRGRELVLFSEDVSITK